MPALLVIFAMLALGPLALAASAPLPLPIRSEDLSFTYRSNDGEVTLSCRHKPAQPGTHDWRVSCGEDTPLARDYFVHLLVRKYVTTARKPEVAYEILYWVSDRNPPGAFKFTSAVSWLRFERETDLHSASFSQSVENDYASLVVTLGSFGSQGIPGSRNGR
ncbi:MAG: hypothetical protein NDJ89_12445 [Oligoflexia bacterium]|nr:hypothetical protein [Oligoflexia bacterium]